MAEHAFLSPSAAKQWQSCTPSVKLEQAFDEQSSCFAEEGTAAHALAEYKLLQALGEETERPEIDYIDDEMERATDGYVTFCLEQIEGAKQLCSDPVVLVEQRVSVDSYAPETFGTADLLIVADDWLTVVDLKYGKGVEVQADHNPQMMIYALGAYELLGSLYDIKRCRMVIYQPRLDNVSFFELELDELLDWAETVLRPRALLALKGEGNFLAGEHCRFCRARATCRARSEENLKLAQFDFKEPALLEDAEIAEVLGKAKQLSLWVDDVYAYAEDQAINHDRVWPGFKVVRGRSARRYSDEEQVAQALQAAGYQDIYKHSLYGITDMEKKLGKQTFSELLSDLIIKPDGKPTLVPESDKREAVSSIQSAIQDCKENN